MTHQNSLKVYVPYELDLADLFSNNEALTFLAGAGISIEPPSNLISARQMMGAIVSFGVPESAIDEVLAIPNLRYEVLIEAFRDRYDKDLKLMEFFEKAKETNRIHQFLAHMIKKGNVVMTTNFDTLIERAVGLGEPNLRVVITQSDFEKYGDPVKNQGEGLLPVYKIHGSVTNPVTGEDTKDSIITTLDALGKLKKTDLSIEAHKRSFFQMATRERTLIIMGYSGGDDLDIIPTLLQMQEINQVIWIVHNPDETSDIQMFKIAPQVNLNAEEIKELKREDQILYQLSLLVEKDVIKVSAHTGSLISNQTSPPISSGTNKLNPLGWISKNIRPPIEGEKEFFAGRVFLDYEQHQDALKYLKQSYEISSKYQKDVNIDLMSRASGNLGLFYMDTGEFDKALQNHQESYTLHERINDTEGMVRSLINIGLTYYSLQKYEQAVESYHKAYRMANQSKDIKGMALASANRGLVYMEQERFRMAVASFKNATDLFTQVGDFKGIAMSLSNRGLVNKRLGDWKKALELYQESYEIHEKIGALEGMAANLTNIANIHNEQGDQEKTLTYREKAKKIDQHLKNLKGVLVDLQDEELDRELLMRALKELEFT